MLEKHIERKFNLYVMDRGGLSVKLSAQFFKGIPDRLVITHTQRIYFLELKMQTGKIKKYQKYVHKTLKRLGQDVRTAYSYEEAIKQYEEICSS